MSGAVQELGDKPIDPSSHNTSTTLSDDVASDSAMAIEAVEQPIDQSMFSTTAWPAFSFLSNEEVRALLPIEDFKLELQEFGCESLIPEQEQELQEELVHEDLDVPAVQTVESSRLVRLATFVGLGGLFAREESVDLEEPELEEPQVEEPVKSQKQLLAEAILENQEILDAYKSKVTDFAGELLESFKADPDTLSFVKIFLFSQFIVEQTNIIGSCFYYLNHDDKTENELIGNIGEATKDWAKALKKELEQVLSASSCWDRIIDAMALLSSWDFSSYARYSLDYHVARHIKELNPTIVTMSEFKSLRRYAEFLTHLSNFEEKSSETEDTCVIDHRFSGRSVVYSQAFSLARDESWLFSNPITRKALASLIEAAREDYLKFAVVPTLEAAGQELYQDQGAADNALFTDLALPYERESLRQQALAMGSYGAMVPLSWGYSSDGVTEKTVEQAAKLFGTLVTHFHRIVSERRFTSSKNLNFALADAAWSPHYQKDAGFTLGRMIGRMVARPYKQIRLTTAKFLESADENQIAVWDAIAGDTGRAFGSRPLCVPNGLSMEVARTYFSKTGTWSEQEHLGILGNKLDSEGLNHLLLIADGDVKGLQIFAMHYQNANGLIPSDISNTELMQATSLDPLLATLEERFRAEQRSVPELLNHAFKLLKERNELSDLKNVAGFMSMVGSDYVDQLDANNRYRFNCLDMIPERVEYALQKVFKGEVDLTPDDFVKVMSSDQLIETLIGVKDQQMLLPATSAIVLDLEDAPERLLKLYPQGVFEDLASQPADTGMQVQRVAVRQALLEALREEIDEFKALSVSEIEQKLSPNMLVTDALWTQFQASPSAAAAWGKFAIARKLQESESFRLRETAWNLINSHSFQTTTLDKILRSHLGPAPQLKISVVAKSDPVTWLMDPKESKLPDPRSSLLRVELGEESFTVPMRLSDDGKEITVEHFHFNRAFSGKEDRIQGIIAKILPQYVAGRLEYNTQNTELLKCERIVMGPVYTDKKYARQFKELSVEKEPDSTLEKSSYIIWEKKVTEQS